VERRSPPPNPCQIDWPETTSSRPSHLSDILDQHACRDRGDLGTTYVADNFYLRDWTWENILRCIFIFPAYGGNKTWGPIPVGWGLQVEDCFYLIMAMLYLAIGRLPHRTRLPHRRDVFLLRLLNRLCRPPRNDQTPI
jgi:hypothetical protein